MSWSHATMLVLIGFIAIGSAYCFRPKQRNRRVRNAREIPETARRPWPIADYSAAYQEKVRQLGTRYLFHTPINRRGSYVQRIP